MVSWSRVLAVLSVMELESLASSKVARAQTPAATPSQVARSRSSSTATPATTITCARKSRT